MVLIKTIPDANNIDNLGILRKHLEEYYEWLNGSAIEIHNLYMHQRIQCVCKGLKITKEQNPSVISSFCSIK
jgi:hypothetical protein